MTAGQKIIIKQTTEGFMSVRPALQGFSLYAFKNEIFLQTSQNAKKLVPGWRKRSFEAFSGNIWLIVTGGKTLRLEMFQLSKKQRRRQRFPAKCLNRFTAMQASMIQRHPEPSGRQWENLLLAASPLQGPSSVPTDRSWLLPLIMLQPSPKYFKLKRHWPHWI